MDSRHDQEETYQKAMTEHRQSCAYWAQFILDKAQYTELRKQYYDTGAFGGHLSVYGFIQKHRQDLYQEYLVWLTKRKLLGD